VDLYRPYPSLTAGTAYWSVSPALEAVESDSSVIPVGFDADSTYLGGGPEISCRFGDGCSFGSSLRSRPRPISVCHVALFAASVRPPADFCLAPLFLIAFVGRTACSLEKSSRRHPPRPMPIFCCARSSSSPCVETESEARPSKISGQLRPTQARKPLAAAQSDQFAGGGRECRTGNRRPPASLSDSFSSNQRGLLATEAFVTIPFSNSWPLAVCSHFFEFIDEQGAVHLAGELRENEIYEVVVTTAGGLCPVSFCKIRYS
jgi:hypothetical protein